MDIQIFFWRSLFVGKIGSLCLSTTIFVEAVMNTVDNIKLIFCLLRKFLGSDDSYQVYEFQWIFRLFFQTFCRNFLGLNNVVQTLCRGTLLCNQFFSLKIS